MTFGYLITRTEYVSGETVHIFSADCLPKGWAIAYVLDRSQVESDYDGEIRVVFLRQT